MSAFEGKADILQTHSGVRPWGWTVFMRQADRVESGSAALGGAQIWLVVVPHQKTMTYVARLQCNVIHSGQYTFVISTHVGATIKSRPVLVRESAAPISTPHPPMRTLEVGVRISQINCGVQWARSVCITNSFLVVAAH